VGKFEVSRGQYAAFARDTGRPALGNCYYYSSSEFKPVNDDAAKNWTNPGFDQDDDHPVVCVTWNDARAYVQWLARKTGKEYRLLTEAEWEYAARAGRTGARPWGEDPNEACTHANVQDQTMARVVPAGQGKIWVNAHRCDDGSAYTSRVGRYRANRFGLHDMIGNAGEWVEDCWNDSYSGAPVDGSAWTSGDCARRVDRGGGWDNNPRDARSADRNRDGAAVRDSNLGFRLARTL
jgi:formylglycine-generating enzyme required for sulfatase activity